LVFNKFCEDLGASLCAWGGQEDGEDLWNGCEYATWSHTVLKQLETEMLLPTPQRVEGLAECKIAHDIEAVEVEPQTRINGFARETIQLCNELASLPARPVPVASQRWTTGELGR
jgi:hypothetical protein